MFAGMLMRACGTYSCCKRRIKPDYRFKMCLENGSTYLHAHIRSSLTSVKARTVHLPPSFSISCMPPYHLLYMFFGVMEWGVLTLRPHVATAHGISFTVQRARVGHSGPRTSDIAPRASASCRYLAAVFDSILPEHRAGLATQRACAATYVYLRHFQRHKKLFFFGLSTLSMGSPS